MRVRCSLLVVSAIMLVDMALLSAGSHVLIPENVYVPNRLLAVKTLRRFGVEVSFYPSDAGEDRRTFPFEHAPDMGGKSRLDHDGVTGCSRDLGGSARTRHHCSDGQHVVAGVYFNAFEHGVDISVQALTKYVGGHSDLLLGSVTVRDPALLERLGETRARLGLAVCADECSLALRGLQTCCRAPAPRRAESALKHRQMDGRTPGGGAGLHPALESCPGHELWKRDFTGASGLFSIVFRPEFSGARVRAFVDSLELFKIGYSWAGTTSLAVAYDLRASRHGSAYGDRLVRLSVGMEAAADLIADLEQGLLEMTSSS